MHRKQKEGQTNLAKSVVSQIRDVHEDNYTNPHPSHAVFISVAHIPSCLTTISTHLCRTVMHRKQLKRKPNKSGKICCVANQRRAWGQLHQSPPVPCSFYFCPTHPILFNCHFHPSPQNFHSILPVPATVCFYHRCTRVNWQNMDSIATQQQSIQLIIKQSSFFISFVVGGFTFCWWRCTIKVKYSYIPTGIPQEFFHLCESPATRKTHIVSFHPHGIPSPHPVLHAGL